MMGTPSATFILQRQCAARKLLLLFALCIFIAARCRTENNLLGREVRGHSLNALPSVDNRQCRSTTLSEWDDRKDRFWLKIKSVVAKLEEKKDAGADDASAGAGENPGNGTAVNAAGSTTRRDNHLLYMTLQGRDYSDNFQDLVDRSYYRPLLVLAMDSPTYAFFNRASGTNGHIVAVDISDPADSIKGLIMRAKTEFTMALLEAKWTVIFFEADVFCRTDPAALLTHPAVADKDLAVSAHQAHRPDADELNIGFFIARPAPGLLNVLCLLANWWHNPLRGWDCAGSTQDQAVWDYAVRRGEEEGQFSNSRIKVGGSDWMKGVYNQCGNWTDVHLLRNEESEQFDGRWARIPIELVDNWPRSSDDPTCIHMFVVQGGSARIEQVYDWYHFING